MVLLHDDPTGTMLVINEVNEAACTILRADAVDLVGRSLNDVVATLDPLRNDLRQHARRLPGHLARSRRGPRSTRQPARAGRLRHRHRAQAADVLRPAARRHPGARRPAPARGRAQADRRHARHDRVHHRRDRLDRRHRADQLRHQGDHRLRRGRAPRAARSGRRHSPSSTRPRPRRCSCGPTAPGSRWCASRPATPPDAEPIRLVWNNNVVHDEVGIPAYAVLTGVDVTAERSSTGFTAHLLKAEIATALIGIDVAGRVTVFNAGRVADARLRRGRDDRTTVHRDPRPGPAVTP